MSGPRAFVMGWPVSHSRSPLIHRHWLTRYGIDGDYGAVAVAPEAAEGFLQGLPASGYAGGNVTIPHKEAAFRACASVTPVAGTLGAVNTVWLEEGELCGDNTDVHGFEANLDEHAQAWRSGETALVLGAGGAARAVVQALVGGGYRKVLVLNRTVSRARTLASDFGPRVEATELERLSVHLPAADIVVNATAAGMAGGEAHPVDWSRARPDAIATDIVYVPLATPFLRGAGERGLTVVDGLGMLLHQAAPGFERWFGRLPTVDAELRQLLLDDLRA